MDVTRTLSAVISGATIPALQDGPVLQLPSGVRFRRKSVGAMRVTDAQLQQALQGVAKLPMADQRRMAMTGVVIDLVPLVTLNGDRQLGATNIEQNAYGTWVPLSMMIAVGANTQIPRTGIDSVAETVQHEVGHVISVVTRQDRSEQAAIAYAASH